MAAEVVLLPTYNERENVERAVAAALAALPDADVLVVDDGSPDGTGVIADAIAARDPRVRVLHRGRKEGLGRAYVAAFREALAHGYQRVYQMDADLSHDPAALPRLRDAVLAGAGVAIGSRYTTGGGVEDWGALRRFISRGGNIYAQLVLGLPYRDLTGGFKCWSRAALEAIDVDTLRSDGYAFQIETTYRAHRKGFRVAQVPFTFRDRTLGHSKMSLRIVMEAWPRVLELRWKALRGR